MLTLSVNTRQPSHRILIGPNGQLKFDVRVRSVLNYQNGLGLASNSKVDSRSAGLDLNLVSMIDDCRREAAFFPLMAFYKGYLEMH